MNKKRILCVILNIVLIMILLSGCGSRDVLLDEYKDNMESYFISVADIDYQMNNLVIEDGLTSEELDEKYKYFLDCLDRLNAETARMAEFEVPKQFEMVESLADEAAENMTAAVNLYHQIYESDVYDEGVSVAAEEYYERANKRIRYIRMILQGDIPDELTVEYETEG